MADTPTTAVLLPPAKGAKIGAIQISASVQETHKRTADITAHPIERGSDVADHRRIKQLELSIDGVISGAPITGQEAESAALNGDDTRDRYQGLLDLHESNAVFEVLTGIALYSNMVFENLTVTRDAKTGRAIHFSAVLKQIVIVESLRVAPVKIRRPKQQLGAKGTSAASASTARAVRGSTLADLAGNQQGPRDLKAKLLELGGP